MKDFMEPKLFRPRVWTLRSEDGGAAKVGHTSSNESDKRRLAPNSNHRRSEDDSGHAEDWVKPRTCPLAFVKPDYFRSGRYARCGPHCGQHDLCVFGWERRNGDRGPCASDHYVNHRMIDAAQDARHLPTLGEAVIGTRCAEHRADANSVDRRCDSIPAWFRIHDHGDCCRRGEKCRDCVEPSSISGACIPTDFPNQFIESGKGVRGEIK